MPGKLKLGVSSSQIQAVLDSVDLYKKMFQVKEDSLVCAFDWERTPLEIKKPLLFIANLLIY